MAPYLPLFYLRQKRFFGLIVVKKSEVIGLSVGAGPSTSTSRGPWGDCELLAAGPSPCPTDKMSLTIAEVTANSDFIGGSEGGGGGGGASARVPTLVLTDYPPTHGCDPWFCSQPLTRWTPKCHRHLSIQT